MKRFTGKNALVTGAGSGVGKAIALRLAAEGAGVGVNDISAESAASVVTEIRQEGGRAVALLADCASSEEIASMFGEFLHHFGSLEVLVNQAGTVDWEDFPAVPDELTETQWIKARQEDPEWARARYMPEEEWAFMHSVNLHGVFYCCREALRVMEQSGCGKIINMTSMSGTGVLTAPHYGSAKAAVIGFSRALALEVLPKGIHVNTIAMGPIETGVFDRIRREHPRAERMYETLLENAGVGRTGSPEEVAALAAFLASDEADYVVGQSINISGGLFVP